MSPAVFLILLFSLLPRQRSFLALMLDSLSHVRMTTTTSLVPLRLRRMEQHTRPPTGGNFHPTTSHGSLHLLTSQRTRRCIFSPGDALVSNSLHALSLTYRSFWSLPIFSQPAISRQFECVYTPRPPPLDVRFLPTLLVLGTARTILF